jgi:HSP20 family protein
MPNSFIYLIILTEECIGCPRASRGGKTMTKDTKTAKSAQAPEAKSETQAPEKPGKGQDIEVHQKSSPGGSLSPFDEMERLFDNFMRRGFMPTFGRDWPTWPDLRMPFEQRTPRVDVIDRKDEVIVRAEVPGVDKKDLEVSLTDTTVTIKGSTKHEKTVEEGDYHRAEMTRGSFSRTVGLPGDVDGENAKATFKDGVMELTMPKRARSKRRTIKVE